MVARDDGAQMKLWLRADASKMAGLGHLMRAVSLAEAATEHGIEAILVSDLDADWAKTLQGMAPLPAKDESWTQELDAEDLVVFDGYGFDHALTTRIHESVAITASFEDVDENPRHPWLTINPNIDLPDSDHLLSGPRFAPVRSRFRELGKERTGPIHTVILSSGGYDAGGIVARSVPVLTSMGFDTLVVAGPGAVTEGISGAEVIVAPSDIASVLALADVAVSAAGSTTWELACLGIPSVLVQVADNQRHIGPTAQSYGAAVFLGGPDDIEPGLAQALDLLAGEARRQSMSRAALDMVDGLGARRILDRMLDLIRR